MKNLDRFTEPDNYIEQSGRLIKLKWFALIAAIGIALLFFLSGCNYNNVPKEASDRKKINAEPNGLSIHEISGCEYVVYEAYYKGGITHKGNCKYCIQRKGDTIK